MDRRRYAPVYEWRARHAFVKEFADHFTQEGLSAEDMRRRAAQLHLPDDICFDIDYWGQTAHRRRTAVQLHLPNDIRFDIDYWCQTGRRRVDPHENREPDPNNQSVTIKVVLSSLADTPPGKPARQQHIINDGLASWENIETGEVEISENREIEVMAANLSAAQQGAANAVAIWWKRMGWPEKEHPYRETERDARMLFRWWVLGDNLGNIADNFALEEDRVQSAIKDARRLLGFTGRPPR